MINFLVPDYACILARISYMHKRNQPQVGEILPPQPKLIPLKLY